MIPDTTPEFQPTLPPEQRRLVRWGTITFIGISLAAAIAILAATGPDFGQLWNLVHPIYLIPLGAVVAATWLFDYLRLISLAKALGEKIPCRWGMEAIFINLLFCAVTPLESGGGPMQVVWMKTKGLSSARWMALTVTKAFLGVLLVAIAGTTFFLINPSLLLGTHLLPVFLGIWGGMAGYLAFVIGSLFSPGTIKKIINHLLGWIAGRRRGHHHHRLDGWKTKANDWVDRYHEAMITFFRAKRWGLAAALFWNALFLISLLSIGPLCLYLLGVPVPFLGSLKLMAFLHFMMHFLPTPGASGMAEGGFILLFSRWAPIKILGVATIVWRMFAFYLAVSIGGVIFLHRTGSWLSGRIIRPSRKPSIDT